MSYRKIWIETNGQIPVDENGVSYEIHHIDGNHKNNDIDNLTCLSIKEHFSIHHSQGDWAAANRILQKIKNIEALREIGFTPKTYSQWMAKNKLGMYSDEAQEKANKTKKERGAGFCHNKELASKGGKIGGPKGAKVTNELHKQRGTGVYSKEHQSKAGKKGGAVAGKIPKSDNQKESIKSGMKLLWEKRRLGLLPPRKPRGPNKSKTQAESFEILPIELHQALDSHNYSPDPIDKTFEPNERCEGAQDTLS
jgi:hypothetical protein